jgi:hypothetical protein
LLRRFPFTGTAHPFGNYSFGYDVSRNWGTNDPCFQIPLTDTSVAWIEDFFLLEHMSKDAKKQIETKWGHTEAHLDKGNRAKIPNDLFITFSSAVGEYHVNKEEDVTPKVGVPALSRLSRSLRSGHGARPGRYPGRESASRRMV